MQARNYIHVDIFFSSQNYFVQNNRNMYFQDLLIMEIHKLII